MQFEASYVVLYIFYRKTFCYVGVIVITILILKIYLYLFVKYDDADPLSVTIRALSSRCALLTELLEVIVHTLLEDILCASHDIGDFLEIVSLV